MAVIETPLPPFSLSNGEPKCLPVTVDFVFMTVFFSTLVFLQAMRAQFARLRTDLVPAAAGGTTLPVARIGPPAAGHVRLLRGPGKGGDA